MKCPLPIIALFLLSFGAQGQELSSSDPTNCLSGTWTRKVCNGSGDATVKFSPPKNGTGSGHFQDVDCNNTEMCPQGRSFDFNYKIVSDVAMELKYSNFKICGESRDPKGGTQTFSCKGNSLTFGNNYTRK